MSKNFIFTAILATIILFAYQSISWMMLPIHEDSMRHTPLQDSLMNTMQGMDEAVYVIPMPAPDLSKEEQKKIHNEGVNKPWAMITYHKSWNEDMTVPMILGVLFNLISVCIILFFISKMQLVSFTSKFLVSFLMGVFLVLQSDLMSWNWWSTPLHFTIPEVIDNILGWSLAGLSIAGLYKAEIK